MEKWGYLLSPTITNYGAWGMGIFVTSSHELCGLNPHLTWGFIYAILYIMDKPLKLLGKNVTSSHEFGGQNDLYNSN